MISATRANCFRSVRSLPLGLLIIATALLVIAAGHQAPAAAAVWVVDVTTDSLPTSGACSAAPTDCPLRRAIELAQSGDEIQFDGAVFATAQTIQLMGELTVTRAIRITGPGRDLLTIRGDGSSRVLGLDVVGTFDMTDLTISNGFAGTAASTQYGGGILLEGGNANMNAVSIIGGTVDHATGGGGNVAVTAGTLRMTNSSLFSGVARGGAVGGGLYLDAGGAAIVINGVFTGNESFFEGAAVANDGGFLILTQSTLTQNTAVGQGGALYSKSGTTIVEFCTLAFNDSVGSTTNAREIYVKAGGVFMEHTILVAPTITARGLPQPATICADDLAPNGIQSAGYNLANRPCFLTHPNDLPQQQVGLGPLTFGTATTYYPLLEGSPAIDAGLPNCTTGSTAYSMDFDQRNLPRRLDADGDGLGQCDLGAVEVQAIFVDGFEGGNTSRWM